MYEVYFAAHIHISLIYILKYILAEISLRVKFFLAQNMLGYPASSAARGHHEDPIALSV